MRFSVPNLGQAFWQAFGSVMRVRNVNKPLGTFVRYNDLTAPEREMVDNAVAAANISREMKTCTYSDFPVGSAIKAANDQGETRIFRGSNIENRFLSASICAERSAAMAAVSEKFVHFKTVAVICSKRPGGSPCGLCRQVLVQLGPEATVLCVQDQALNITRFVATELLPAPKAAAVHYTELKKLDSLVVEKMLHAIGKAHAPYTHRMRAAIIEAIDESGAIETFNGLVDENASFGATAQAETIAMRSARAAGFKKCKKLFVCVEQHGANPMDGESLQVLREFGIESDILLVDPNGQCISTCLTELLPDSFGPEAL